MTKDQIHQKTYMRKYYQTHAHMWKKYNEKADPISRAKRYEWYNRLKMKPCKDCHKQYNPWVMQFDHLPGTKKLGTIGIMISWGASIASIKKEISKCDLVCANCHAERTYNRNH